MSDMVSFSREDLLLFKQQYKKAVADKKEVFTFKGKEFVCGYAKYLIEYLDGEFAKEDATNKN